METVLHRLGIEPANPAGYCAPSTWLPGAGQFPSLNLVTNDSQPTLRVGTASAA